jgi:DNA-binding CsgD family transcriptional regulator
MAAALNSPYDAAAVLGFSEPTVRRHWRTAKLWLHRDLRGAS